MDDNAALAQLVQKLSIKVVDIDNELAEFDDRLINGETTVLELLRSVHRELAMLVDVVQVLCQRLGVWPESIDSLSAEATWEDVEAAEAFDG